MPYQAFVFMLRTFGAESSVCLLASVEVPCGRRGFHICFINVCGLFSSFIVFCVSFQKKYL